MAAPAPEDLVPVLVDRWDVLDVLAADPHTKPELEATLGVSRSTVNRAVASLESVDAVERTPPEGYRPTAFGRLVHRLFQTVDGCLDGICDGYALGTDLPSGDLGEAIVFEDATVVRPEPYAPDRPLQRLLDRIASTDHLRAWTPAVLSQYVDVCYDQVTVDALELELVVTPAVHDCLATDYADQYAGALAHEDVRLYETAEPLPFGLVLFGDDTKATGLVLYSDSGVSGFVGNETRAAVGWATELYDEYRARATRVG